MMSVSEQRRLRRRQRFGALLTACFSLLAVLLLPGLASAQEEATAESVHAIVVHQVDARAEATKVVTLADSYDSAAFGGATIVENGEEKSLLSASSALEAGRPMEIVFVIDTERSLAQGDVFVHMRETVAELIRSLPSGQIAVGVIAAGDTAVVRQSLTSDHEAAAAAVDQIRMSESTALFNAIDRSATMFSSAENALRTVVVFSGGPDTASEIGAADARRAAATNRAQVVAVRYAGGEASLTDVVDGAGGFSLAASNADEAAASLTTAVTAASDRYILSYDGITSATERADVNLQVGEAATGFSYPGGTFTDRPVALQLVTVEPASGIGFFRSTMGMYIAIGLAAVALGLAIYAGASIITAGDSSLDGLIRRYSGEESGEELSDEEQALVQTALVKRAVEFSENFAEERGFLVKIEDLLERADLPFRPGEAMSFFVAACFLVLAGTYAWTRSIVFAFILSLLTGVAIFAFVRIKATRRVRAFEKQLPDTLSLLAGTLRAGYSLPQGLEAVSHEIADPMGQELRRVMTEARLGREIEDSMASTAERLDSPDFAWAVMAIGIQREVGGNLNELLMTVADTMTARERLKGEVATLTAEGRMSAMILAGLPPGLGFVMWLMNREYINLLFTETMGRVFIGLAAVSMLIGMAWMKKVVTINV